jgi:lysyl-tRNA synthetase class 1
MQWLNKIVDEVITRYPEGEIIVSSGVSPSGTYHMGYLREIIICDAIITELIRRGKQARHLHFVDDQDGFRKVPTGLPSEYERYLGQPLCDMPAPDGSEDSYADYCLRGFLQSIKTLGIEIDIVRSHEKYREGLFVPAIELVLDHINEARKILEEVSGRKLDQQWSPIQVNEEGYLKKRTFVGIHTPTKIIQYLDKDGIAQTTGYDRGQVKLDWRLDWPARWWLLKVNIEPFGRDHATKGGSYDTGVALMKEIFKAPAPIPVPYNFVNRAGETKKMSASTGNGIEISEVVKVLPPEVAKYFILRTAPEKLLFFDPIDGVIRLIDEFAELVAKPNKTEADKQLMDICTKGVPSIVSNVPFSHLVASYQAALKDPAKTLDIIARTEHREVAQSQETVIKTELQFIDQWLQKWAPDDVKFELAKEVKPSDFSEPELNYLSALADKIAVAPEDADGDWFHKAIYEFKTTDNLEPQQLFGPLYRALITKESGPRAGWFLSILPRDWLIKRLRLEV